MRWSVVCLVTSAAALSSKNLQQEELSKRRILRGLDQDHLDTSSGGISAFEIGQRGEATQTPRRASSNAEAMQISDSSDGGSVAEDLTHDDEDTRVPTSNDTWTGREHDTAPPPGLLGVDEQFNESELTAERPLFVENDTTTEPLTFDELTHMPHSRGNFVPSRPDNATCKDVFGIKTNDTREVKWNIAGVQLVTHGERRKYKTSCTFRMGTFPDGGLAECTESVANNPVCSNNFHLDAKTYACDCVGKDYYPCDIEENSSSCLYQLSPGEFDADDTDVFIQEWNAADKL
mmetsp:Transcript_62972/g.99521  ORF Transcript_62972/g.99521 Transcript_62972/m.99521 type:complete len:290 (+) Transcript_62972:67-936(+)